MRAHPLPRLDDLPADVHVPPVAYLESSWYDHGNGYWSRRARMTFTAVLGLAVMTLLTNVVLNWIGQASMLAFDVALGVEIAGSAVAGTVMIVRTMRLWNDAAIPVQLADGRFRYPGNPKFTGERWVIGLRALFVGFPLAALISTLLPQTLPEHRARLWMANHLAGRGLPIRTRS
jgi:hypothetical protein